MLRNRPRARFESFRAPAARYTLAVGFNNRRQIVGSGGNDIVNASDAQGFLLTGGANGTYRPIEIRGTTRTLGTDINNRGQIVAGIFPVTDQQPDPAPAMDPTPGMPLTADTTPSTYTADQPLEAPRASSCSTPASPRTPGSPSSSAWARSG